MNLTEWIAQTQPRRDELDAFARSPLPTGADVHGETNKLIECEDDAQRFLADAESFLTQYTAQAIFCVRAKHPNSNADERKAHVKDEVRDIQRLVDGISVTARTISSRRFLMMNAARSR